MTQPNPAHALDGGIPSLLPTACHWPAASDEQRSAAMRVLVSAFCILLSGCVLVPREGEKELGSIPKGPASQAVIQASLPRDARAIKFVCGTAAPTDFGQQHVVVTLTNTS